MRWHGYSGGDQQDGRHWRTKWDSFNKGKEPDLAAWSPSSDPEPQMGQSAEVSVYSAHIVMAGVAGCSQQPCVYTGLADCRAHPQSYTFALKRNRGRRQGRKALLEKQVHVMPGDTSIAGLTLFLLP